MSAVDPPSSAPTPDGETNSRRYPRLTCFIAVLVRATNPNLFLMGNLSTVGLGGCGVELKASVGVGTKVEVAPLENERLSVAGTVVNLRILSGKPGYGIGIEFTDAEEHVAELVQFAERRPKPTISNIGRNGAGSKSESRDSGMDTTSNP
jgi:hypothetical protein